MSNLQQRVMNHMLPTHQELGLSIKQHKQICAAIMELLGVELMILVDDVFEEITSRKPQPRPDYSDPKYSQPGPQRFFKS